MKASLRWLAPLALVALFASPTLAAERFWVDPNGGGFNTTTNWSATSGGASGASVPDSSDVANFTLPDTYTVSFTIDPTNLGLDVENGNVTFDLSGHTYTTTASFGMGIGTVSNQTGRLTIIDGSLVGDSVSDDIIVGAGPNETGFLTISTLGSLGSGIEDLIVGSSGRGVFTVQNGGEVNTRVSTIGSSSFSSNSATVTGIGSTWTSALSMTIGSSGTGSLSVFSGGTVAVNNFASIANISTSNGTLRVNGTGSSFSTSSNLVVGGAGNGSLSIENGGSVTSGAGGLIASNSEGSVGNALVTGSNSRWDIVGQLSVGRFGHGTLNVNNGAQVTADTFVVGDQSIGQGFATISGTDSRLTTTSSLTAGSSGIGSLIVENGGQLATASTARIGNFSNAVGDVTIRGQGTQWSNNGNVFVSNSGTGTLNVSDNASVSIGGLLHVVDPTGTQIGTLNFDGGSITATSFTRDGIFNWTDGTLKINGGTFSNANVSLVIDGADASDFPTLHMANDAVTDAGFLGANLTVANANRAALDITGSSFVSVSTVFVGNLDGSEGTVTVAGNNSILTAANNIILGSAGGKATLNVQTGGSVVTNGALQLSAGATVNLDGGTLLIGSLSTIGGQINFNAGRLLFLNSISANDTMLDVVLGQSHQLGAGRTLAANNTLTLTDSLTVDGGTIVADTIDISGSNPILQADSGSITAIINFTVGAAASVTLGAASIDGRTTLQNNGRITMNSPFGRITGATLANGGTLQGTGRIDAQLVNQVPGVVRASSNDHLLFANAINVNAGRIDINGSTSLAAVEFDQDLSNQSTARIDMQGTSELHVKGFTGLTNDGLVNIGFADATVYGNIVNNATGSIGVAFSNTTFAAGDITNNGSIIVSGNSNVLFSNDVTNGAGATLHVESGSHAVFFGAYNGGNTGTGTVTMHGDLAPGSSPGISTFGGPVSFGPLSSTDIEIFGINPGTGYDQVVATQSTSLDGSLKLTVDTSIFTPAYGDAFTILTYGSRTGTYDSVTLNGSILALTTDLALAPVYDFAGSSNPLFADTFFAAAPNTLTLFTTLPGDANLDLMINSADLSLLLANFGKTGAAWTGGDFTGDGLVNGADLSLLLSNFGSDVRSLIGSTGIAVNVATIPEPASGVVLALCGSLMLARRNHRRARV